MSAGPLWRAAPGRLLRQRGWFLVLAAAAALLAACLTSVPLFERSVVATAVTTEIRAAAGSPFQRDSPLLRVVVQGVVPPDVDSGLREVLDGLPELGQPRVSAFGVAERVDPRRTTSVVRVGAVETRATLHFHDGAVERLAERVGGTDGPGVWLSEDVAATLGATVGDDVTFVVTTRRSPPPGEVPPPDVGATARLVGTFPAAPETGAPDVGPLTDWVPSARDLPMVGDGRGRSALALADRETFDRLVLEIGEQPLWLADLALPGDPTPDEARRAADAVTALGQDAYRESSTIQRLTAQALPWPSSAQVVSGLPAIVSRADTAAVTAQAQVRSLAWAAVPLGVAAVCAGVLLLHRSRRAENALAAGLGLRSAGAAALAVLESAAPLAVGAVAGAGLAWAVVALLGPSAQLGTDVALVVLAGAGVSLVVALAAVGVGVALAAAVTARSTTAGLGRPRRRVPWEAVLVTAVVVAAVGLGRADASRAPGALAVGFPLLVAAATAAVAQRLVGVRLPGRLRRAGRPREHADPGRRRIGTAGWLAARRVRHAGREATATVVVVSVGLSLALWSVAADRGVQRGVEDKVAATAGAETVVAVAGSWEHADPTAEPAGGERADTPSGAEVRVPRPDVPDATFVWRNRTSLPPRFGQVDLLVVEPEGFDGVALWGASGALAPGRDALPVLAAGPLGDGTRTGEAAGGQEIPVVMVGGRHRVGDRGTLNLRDQWAVRFEVVAAVEAFPGLGGRGVVADAASILSVVPGYLDPTVRQTSPGPGSGFRTEVWSSRPADDAALAAAGLSTAEATTRTQAEDAPGLRGARWPLAYLLALGACAALLAVVALLLQAVRVADRDRLAELVLRHMGMPRRRLVAARARETAGVLAVAGGAAVLSVVGLAAFGPSLVDPAARLAPVVHPIVSWVDVAVLLAGLAVLVAAATAVARRRAGGVPAGEVLRGED